jgi:hypothetical protein
MGICISKDNQVIPFEPKPLDTIEEEVSYRNEPSPIRTGFRGLKKLKNK